MLITTTRGLITLVTILQKRYFTKTMTIKNKRTTYNVPTDCGYYTCHSKNKLTQFKLRMRLIKVINTDTKKIYHL